MALVSVVIPVFNMWALTKACLESLASTSHLADLEVIVIDNASSDATATECLPLGQFLFGDAFHYLPQEKNKNFGPACNIGTQQAQGEFIFFLHNDTILTEDWLTPLLACLTADATLGAVGPLLLYPEFGSYKDRVQHLGIAINHELECQHIYEGFPVAHPAVQRKRYFQAITGAAFLIRKQLFDEVGGFDENFINYYEDVDLCVRIAQLGYRFTCEPVSKVYHLCGQTTKGYNFASHNHKRYIERVTSHISADFHLFTQEDGFECRLTPWLRIKACLPNVKTNILNKRIAQNSPLEVAEKLLEAEPLWELGYFWVAAAQHNLKDAVALMQLLIKNNYEPDSALSLLEYAYACKDNQAIESAMFVIVKMIKTMTSYKHQAKQLEILSASAGCIDMVQQAQEWQQNAVSFRQEHLVPFLNRLKSNNMLAYNFGQLPVAYSAWVELFDTPTEESYQEISRTLKSRKDWSYISIVMPTYNPYLTYLEQAITSVRTQSYPYWELCIADDASTDPGVAAILNRHMAEDPRIKVVFRKKNGHISRSSNSAIELVSHQWTALMDHDDMLARDALFHVACAIQDNPQGLLFYSDEDKIGTDGSRNSPYFKTGFDPDMFYCANFISHLGVYNTERLRAVGGFRVGFEGSQDHDLAMRFINGLPHDTIVHIPKILYHWRIHEQSTALSIKSKPYAVNAAQKTVLEQLESIGRPGALRQYTKNNFNVVRWQQVDKDSTVSLILFCSDGRYPRALLDSIAKENDIKPHECILVPVNAPIEQPKEKQAAHEKLSVRMLQCEKNLDQANLYAQVVAASHGQILGFLNGDLKPTRRSWLKQLVAEVTQPYIGVAGGLLWHNDKVYNAGYYPNEHGFVFPLFHGIESRSYDWTYMGWLTITHRVLAMPADCLFCRREVWEAAGGFTKDTGKWGAVDFSLRLWEKKLATLYSPLAHFDFPTAPPLKLPLTDDRGAQKLLARWSTKLRQSELRNPNFYVVDNSWSLFPLQEHQEFVY